MKKLLLLKNNFFSIKKTKRNFTALLIMVCGLFANSISAQTVYTWVGGTDNIWENAANWSPNGVPGGNSGDTVFIENGASVLYSTNTSPVTVINKITLSNFTGPSAGSTLTIAPGASLRVNAGSGTVAVAINGGNFVNNGVLFVQSSSASGSVALFNFGNPATAPVGGPFTYGYTSGAGSSFSATATSTGTSSTAFLMNGTAANSNSKYSLVINGNNTFNFTTVNTFAIRTIASAAPVSIGGAGFTTTTNGLLLVNPSSNVTVEAGTVIGSNPGTSNTQQNIIVQSNSTLTNKGTINIGGATSQHGIQIQGLANTTTTFDNQGTLDINISSSTTSRAALGIQNGDSTGNVNITNSGTMNLKNTRPFATNVGSAFIVAGTTSNVNFTNNGSLNLSGTNVNLGGITPTTLTNNGTITSNQEIKTMTVLNNSGKKISFVQDVSTLAATSALTTGVVFVTNNGIIETATGATQLNNLAGVAGLSSSSSIEPGGSGGKGIASFSGASFPILGTLKLQVAGNTAAGTDYDQVNNVLTDGGFDVSGATLDVTGMSSASSPVDIILANGAGTITGTFASVVGLESGWSVNYGVSGKVQLVNPSLKVNVSDFNQNNVSVYKNNGTLYINSGTVAISNIKVYDLLGRMVVEQKGVKANTASISNLKASNQVLIVKIVGENNALVTKKVIY